MSKKSSKKSKNLKNNKEKSSKKSKNLKNNNNIHETSSADIKKQLDNDAIQEEQKPLDINTFVYEGSPYNWWKANNVLASVSGIIVLFGILLMISAAFLGFSLDFKQDSTNRFYTLFRFFYVAAPLVLFIRIGLSEFFSKSSKLKLVWYIIGALLSGAVAYLSFGLNFQNTILISLILVGIAYYVFANFKTLHHSDVWFNYFVLFVLFGALFGLAIGFYHLDVRMYRLFVTPKILTIYPAAAILIIFSSLWVGISKNRKDIIYLPYVLLLFGYFLWLIFNIYHSGMPRVTFYGSIVRRMGVITVFSLIIFAISIHLWIRKDIRRIRFLLYFFLFIGILLSLRAFVEISYPNIKGFKPSGFAGNRDFFGDHFIFIFLASFFLYFKEKSIPLMIFNLISMVLAFYAVVLTHTRGAWLGIGIASFVGMFLFNPRLDLKSDELLHRTLLLLGGLVIGFIIFYAYLISTIDPSIVKPSLKNSAKSALYANKSGSVFVFITISPLIFKLFWSYFNDIKLRLSFLSVVAFLALLIVIIPSSRRVILNTVSRAVKLDKLMNTKNGEARFNVWKDEIPLIKKHWKTGVGRETFRVRFLKYKTFNLAIKDPGVNYRSSHNTYLDELAMEGLPGLLFFLSILGMGIWMALKYARKKYHSLALAVSIPLIGYLGHILVSYDVIPTLLNMYLFSAMSVSIGFAALVAQLNNSENAVQENKQPQRGFIYFDLAFIGVIIGIVVLIFAIRFVRNEVKADLNLTKMAKSSAILKSYSKISQRLLSPQKIKMLEKALSNYQNNKLDRNTILILSSFSKIKPKQLATQRNKILPKLQKIVMNQIASAQNKELILKQRYGAKVKESIQIIWNKSHETIKLIPNMGYIAYKCASMLHTLSRLPDQDLVDLGGKEKIAKEAIKFAIYGTKNNTNPESAYSRLGSIYYSYAFSLLKQRKLAKAYKYFQKAVEGIQGSIDHDQFYYDTHRLKGVILLERFCDLEQAEKEIKLAESILSNSKIGKAKQALKRLQATTIPLLERYQQNPRLLQQCKMRLNAMKKAYKESLSGTKP